MVPEQMCPEAPRYRAHSGKPVPNLTNRLLNVMSASIASPTVSNGRRE